MKNVCDWRLFASSVQGDNHVKQNKINQDAWNWRMRQDCAVMAVSDGHGSERCFRSHHGSKFACQAVINSFYNFIQETGADEKGFTGLRDRLEAEFPERILKDWSRLVQNHLGTSPIKSYEFDKLRDKASGDAGQAIDDNPQLAYGATLLFAAITTEFTYLLQVGDGSISIVREKGEGGIEVEEPIGIDTHDAAGATMSLCLAKKADFRQKLIPLEEQPLLIALSTDGLVDSYPNTSDFNRQIGDFPREIRNKGLGRFMVDLEAWLDTTTKKGSGDDITVGILTREGGRPPRVNIRELVLKGVEGTMIEAILDPVTGEYNKLELILKELPAPAVPTPDKTVSS